MSLKLERDLSADARTQVARARAAAQSKNYDYAISLLQNVLKEEPLYLEGRFHLRAAEIQKFNALSGFQKQMVSVKTGSAAMKLSTAGKKEPTEQLLLAEEVLALDPFNVKANTLVGDAGVALGYPAFRTFAFETLAQGRPTDKAVLSTLAKTYMELHEPVKAEKTYQRILDIDPRDGDALSGLKNASAAHASRAGGWEEKGGDYRNALKDKKEAEALEQSSKVVKSAEAIDAQIQALYVKHQEEPTNPLHSRAIANLFLQKNDYANAILFFQHAFEAGGKIDNAIEKQISDLKLKQSEQELQQLRDVLAQETDPEKRAELEAGVAQKQIEMDQVRVEQAEARVRSYPNEGQFRYELGEALFRVGQYKRATEELQLGLKQPSVRYQALNLMGQSFIKRGMLDFAVKQLALGESELGPMDEIKKEIVYNLGLAYEASKKPDLALEQWKKIYEHDMGYRDVSQRVESSYGNG
jgi:tetratricopeptide (TPR) repeat protein